jgi:hypothetical protein
MKYPDFYDKVEPIQVVDPIAAILGAFEEGKYAISYLDVVKSAGHSCPTVAGAYIMTAAAMKVLFGDERVVRGDVDVSFEEDLEDGVAGVVGNVISHITGATDKSGFKGLGGKFARHSLMHFNADINSSARFMRVSTGKSVDVDYNPNVIPADPQMMPLMQKILSGAASSEEKKLFAALWQARVEKIFENIEAVVKVTPL